MTEPKNTVEDLQFALQMGKRSRSEKVQAGNPHELVINQHIFPKKSIDRFATDGGVELADIKRHLIRRAKSTDTIFCADRAWSDGAERGWMKKIEDDFQEVSQIILLNPLMPLTAANYHVIREFYLLWHARAERRHLPIQYIKPNGVLGATISTTADDVEFLERGGIAVIRTDGSFAYRDFNTGDIVLRMGELEEEIAHLPWGVIIAQDAQFCVPDTPAHGVIPISPSIALRINSRSGRITRSSVSNINRQMVNKATDYFFAGTLAACPGIPAFIHSDGHNK